MVVNNQAMMMDRLKREFNDLGYVENLRREDYTFADFLGTTYATKQIALAVFAQEPPSYRNAAFGVALANGQSGAQLVQAHRSLGAPQILEIDGGELHRWRIGIGKPERLDTVDYEGVPELFAAHRSEWSPIRILRAKSSRTEAKQLDFLDYDLVPLLDHEVRTKLDDLLKDTIKLAIAVLEEHVGFGPDDYPPLFRLVFRLIAAKVLADRGQPGDWTSTDATSAIRAVEEFYFKNEEPDQLILDGTTQEAIWEQIRNAFHFQNLSVDSLAYVYENTMITAETRKLFGVHSTPRAIAEYIVRRLPFEELHVDDRRVFEPFSGHSVFLVAAMQRLRELLPSEIDSEERHRYFVDMLSGIELDDFAREVAKLSLMLADYPNPDGWRLIGDDAFQSPAFRKELSRASVVLCNPPFEDMDIEEQKRYGQVKAVPKPVAILTRILEDPPALLGFVLPRAFLTGVPYRDLRAKLQETYESVELLVLPDAVFKHSDAETVLLIMSGVGAETSKLRTAEVYKADLAEFYRSGTVSYIEEASGEAARRPERWQPMKLRGVWEATADMPCLGDLATIRRGIEFNMPLDEYRHELVADEPRIGFKRGILKTHDSLEPFVVTSTVFLNAMPNRMKGRAIDLPWSEPKLIVNKARRSRGPWALTAAIDRSGLVCYQNAYGIWPHPGLSVEVASAILNSAVANALIDTVEGKRDIRKSTLERIPVPHLDDTMEEAILGLVRAYSECRHLWLAGRISEASARRRCKHLLGLIDVTVLRAYDLPFSIESLLLEHLRSHERVSPADPSLAGVVTADSFLRTALRRAEALDPIEEESCWADDIGVALSQYGTVAVDLLRRYWMDGQLQGEVLTETLERLGQINEWSSRPARRLLLDDALSVPEAEVRYAAAAGLTLMGDTAALNILKTAAKDENNPLVKRLMEDAVRLSQA